MVSSKGASTRRSRHWTRSIVLCLLVLFTVWFSTVPALAGTPDLFILSIGVSD